MNTLHMFPLTCRWGYFQVACVLILFHDFLDHLDGIVAKAQRRVYGPSDDPLLGAFLDAFCDKVSVMPYTSYSAHMTQRVPISL